jgi:tRNA (guanine-N7-)-methyltransferase
MIDPKQFIITRKRKKYKFALFANSPICFEADKWTKRHVDVLEIGAGTGLFSVKLASRYPDKQFVAVDVKADRLQQGARQAAERGLSNIFFVRARADQLPDMFDAHSLRTIWVTFPDPFPKKRSAGRRLLHPTFLAIYHQLLTPKGELYFKTDARDLFLWSLEQLVAKNWQLQQLSFDLHESALSDDYKIETTYESRYRAEGIAINFVVAMPPAHND